MAQATKTVQQGVSGVGGKVWTIERVAQLNPFVRRAAGRYSLHHGGAWILVLKEGRGKWQVWVLRSGSTWKLLERAKTLKAAKWSAHVECAKLIGVTLEPTEVLS